MMKKDKANRDSLIHQDYLLKSEHQLLKREHLLLKREHQLIASTVY